MQKPHCDFLWLLSQETKVPTQHKLSPYNEGFNNSNMFKSIWCGYKEEAQRETENPECRGLYTAAKKNKSRRKKKQKTTIPTLR